MDPTLISNPVANQWVVEMTKFVDHQIDINREIPAVSIFHLPESITTKKPEAYEPQQIGLGPIQHFRPGPYRNMQQQKLLVARKDLQEIKKEEDGKLIGLNKAQQLVPVVRELVPIVRSCYNIFLKDDDDSLAMIFAIDGLFLLNLFQTYNIGIGEKEAYLLLLKEKAYEFKGRFFTEYGPEESAYLPLILRQEELVVNSKNQTEFEKSLHLPHQQFQRPKFGTRRRAIVQDIMMVPNQIPFMVLKEIKEGLHPSSGSFSPYEFRIFCKIHSPLKLCSKSQALTKNVNHVLHYLYDSIVNNYTPVQDTANQYKEESQKTEDGQKPQNRMGLVDLINPINFISKVPKEEIVQLYEKSVSILESFTQSETLLITSASKLHYKAGFMFHGLLKHQGIQNIYKKDIDIYLPCVTLNNDSEVVLRNLVVYETLTDNADKFPLTEYMGLMCALIVNVDDVQYLRDQKVIDGEMGDDEVVKLFNEMSTCIQSITTKEESNLLRKMIDEVNTVYNNRLEMKMYLILKNLAGWLLVKLKSFGKIVEHSWKIVAFMIGIVAVFMLTYQAYCDVYGCH